MHREPRLAALRFAAKVAFSVSAVAACRETQPDPATPPAASPAASSNAPKSCDAILRVAFPTHADYPGTDQKLSSAVHACCLDDLTSKGESSPYRWDCCASVDKGPDSRKLGTACTPWGPPTPPAMRV